MVRFLALLALLCALTCPALAKGFPFNIPLYYNPNGGRYFHTLSNCDTIDPKYWDGMVSFLGDELDDAPYNALRPCQMCDADANLSSLPPESTLQNSVIDFPIHTTIDSEEHARYLALYTADCERAYADYGHGRAGASRIYRIFCPCRYRRRQFFSGIRGNTVHPAGRNHALL